MNQATTVTKPTATLAGRLFPFDSEFSEHRTELDSGSFPDPPALRAARLAREAAETRIEEKAAIQADKYLSDDGKREKLKTTHDQAAARLQVPQKFLLSMEQEIEEHKARLAPKPLDPADAVAAAAGTEYRAFLRGMDGDKRLAVVNRAVLNADLETLAKICAGPPELSGLSEKMWNVARETLIEKQSPERLERVRTLEANADALRRAVRAAESIVNEIGGQPFDRSMVVVR